MTRRERTGGESVYNLLVSYRSGDMWAPRSIRRRPWRGSQILCGVYNKNQKPFNDGVAGLRS